MSKERAEALEQVRIKEDPTNLANSYRSERRWGKWTKILLGIAGGSAVAAAVVFFNLLPVIPAAALPWIKALLGAGVVGGAGGAVLSEVGRGTAIFGKKKYK